MAPASPTDPTAVSEPIYPAIESFVETAEASDIEGLFGPLKAELSSLKGPKGEAGKRALGAIAKAEDLLRHLLEVREKIKKNK